MRQGEHQHSVGSKATLRFLHIAFESDDWVAILLNSYDTGQVVQRVGSIQWLAKNGFIVGLRTMSAAGSTCM